MKKLFLLFLFLLPAPAWAQCNGVFLPNTVCGNPNVGASPPTQAPASSFTALTVGVSPITGGVANGILFDSAGILQNNGPIVSSVSNPTGNGQWSIGATSSLGVVTIGQGSVNDNSLENSLGNVALGVPTGTSHLAPGAGNVPTNNACTGFALSTGSTDVAGRVTFTSATSCAINFGHSFTNAPFCVVSPGSAASTNFVTTTTGVLTVTFGTAQTAMMYQCFGG